jgi:uncharacterized protein (DUF305 family)
MVASSRSMKARVASRMNSLRANRERQSSGARVRWALTERMRVYFLFLVLVSFTACRTAGSTAVETHPPIVQPGAPGEPTRVIGAQQAVDLSQVQYIGADIKFMQGMIGHHAQAIEMTDLLRTHSDSGDMKKLALRIELSQVDEIKMMQRWLADRGQRVPTGREHHTHGAALMPGMLTPDDMSRLDAARGVEFDRLFLEYMIRHHEGALTMVKDLFASPGAAQESEVFAFASDVEADQTAEIDRMGAMLNTLTKERHR